MGTEIVLAHLDDPVLAALSTLGIPVDTTKTLEGWDRSRRVVLALLDPVVSGAPGLATLTLMEPREVRLRHAISVPASDVGRLVASMDRALEPVGEPWPALVASMPGARARGLPGRGAIALIPDVEAVRIVVIDHTELRDPVTDLETYVADLEPQADDTQGTAALELSTRPELTVTALVRPWRVRALAVMLGMEAVHEQLPEIEPAFRRSALATGRNIELRCEHLLSMPREIDDWAVGLDADGPRSRSLVVGSLTEHGRARMDEVTTVEPVALRRDDLLAHTFFGLAPSNSEPAVSARELQPCGALAPLIVAMSAPSMWVGTMVDGSSWGRGLGASVCRRKLHER